MGSSWFRRSAFVFWVCLISVAVFHGPAEASEVSLDYLRIQEAFLGEHFKQTLSLANAFIREYPDVPEVPRIRLWRLLSLHRMGMSRQAIRELDELRWSTDKSAPIWPEMLYWEGRIAESVGSWVRAQLAYQRLQDEYPDSDWAKEALLGLGLALIQRGRYDRATSYLSQLYQSGAQASVRTQARLLEGFCALKQEQFWRALTLMDSLLQKERDIAAPVAAQIHFYRAEAYVGLKDPAKADAAYRQARAASPDSRWGQAAAFGMGWNAYMNGDCDGALEALDQYAKTGRDENRAEALYAEGACFLEGGHQREAMARFEELETRFPNHAFVAKSRVALAELFRQHGDVERAQVMLKGLLHKVRDDSLKEMVWVYLGRVALDRSQADVAHYYFERSAKSEDTYVRQASLRGEADVHLFLDEQGRAIDDYERSMRLSAKSKNEEYFYAAHELARLYMSRERYTEAEGLLEELAGCKIESLRREAQLLQAVLAIRQNRRQLARSKLELLRKTEDNPEIGQRADYYLALLELSDGNWDEAMTLLKRSLKGHPWSDESVEARLLLADMRADSEGPADVLPWLGREYADAPLAQKNKAVFALRLADLALRWGATGKAMHWYEEAQALAPALEDEVLYRLGECYEELGDMDLAIARYQSISEEPWLVKGRLAAARLLEREGRLGQAKDLYEQLLAKPIQDPKIVEEQLLALQSEGESYEK